MTDTSRVTLGMVPTVIFAIFYIFSTFLSVMGYVQVFALALGTNIGPHLGFLGVDSCSQADLDYGSGQCWPAYAISVGIFGVLVWILAILGFRETYHIQMGFTVIRILVLLLMVITMLTDTSLSNFPGVEDADESDPVYGTSGFYFNFRGMVEAIPILSYTFINLDTAPSVAAAMKPKLRKNIRLVYLLSYTILLFFYLLVANTLTAVLAANGKHVTDSINLVWNSYGGDNASVGQLIIRYLVVFLPPLDVLSSFPIQTTALVGNCVAFVCGQKYHIPESGFSFRRVAIFSVVVLIPVVLALFFTSLSGNLDFSGPMSIAFAYLFPVFFAWKSREISIKYFGYAAGAITPFTNKYSRPWFYWVSGTFFTALVIYLVIGLTPVLSQ